MSDEEGSIPMKERVKRYVPISNAADRFGVSRPTFYQFMQNYDEGRTRDIPENVKEFLDLVAEDPQPEKVKVFLTVKGNPNDDGKPIKMKDIRDDASEYEAMLVEMDLLTKMINETEAKYHDIRMMMDKTADELHTVERLIKQNPQDSAEYRMRAEALQERITSLRNEMKIIQTERFSSEKNLMELRSRIKEFEMSRRFKGVNRMNDWTEDGDLMTMCVGSNGRSMVLFQLLDDEAIDQEFTVSLIMGTPVGDMVIGEYTPEKGRRFVLIDDVLPTLKIQYEVTCRYGEKTVRSGRYQLQLK